MNGRERSNNHRRYDGPVPREDWLRARAHAEPGTRAASVEAWRHVRFWAHAACRARPDATERERCRHWLGRALGDWHAARAEEGAALARKEWSEQMERLGRTPRGFGHLEPARRPPSAALSAAAHARPETVRSD